MTLSTKFNSGKIYIYIYILYIYIIYIYIYIYIYAFNQLNILINSKIQFLQKHTDKNN